MATEGDVSRTLPLPTGTWVCCVCDEPQTGSPYMAASGEVPACEWCWGQTTTVARVFSDDHQKVAHSDDCSCARGDSGASS